MFYILVLTLILLMRYYLFSKASLKAVDQWFWLKYRDKVREQKKCPPHIENYILEVKQWYPPLFGYILSHISSIQYFNIITLLLSVFRFCLVISLIYYVESEFYTSLFLAAIIYITAPILVYYDNQINSRIFGALVLDILILLLFFYVDFDSMVFLPLVVVFTFLLIFTHKMSHQLYLFILIMYSIFYLDVMPLLMYIVTTVIALKFNYKNYLWAHIEIVKFWHRNRYKLGAHQFYESLLYGKTDFAYKNRLHGDGIKSVIKKLSLIIGMFPFFIFLLFNLEPGFLGLVCASTILFIFLTSFLDKALCLGSGTLYMYNLVTFSIFYVVTREVAYTTIYNQLILGIVVLMTIFSIYRFYKGLNVKNQRIEFDEAIDFLKHTNLDRVLVIPFQLPDEVAYKTNKKVFWGGHGLGFLWLEPYFPVFNEKIEKAIEDWNLGAVFLEKNYYREFSDVVDMQLFTIVFENDEFIIFEVNNWQDYDKIPDEMRKQYPNIVGNLNV